MKTTTLTAEVKGAVSPGSILVKLYQHDKVVDRKTYKQSFVHDFNDLSGDYVLYVLGISPLSTDAKLTFILDDKNIIINKTLSSDNPTIIKKDEDVYAFRFYFSTKS